MAIVGFLDQSIFFFTLLGIRDNLTSLIAGDFLGPAQRLLLASIGITGLVSSFRFDLPLVFVGIEVDQDVLVYFDADKNQWQVKTEGADQASDSYTSKKEALGRAKEIASNKGSQVVSYTKQGKKENWLV